MKTQLARLTLVLILVSMACSLTNFADPTLQPSPQVVTEVTNSPEPEPTATFTPTPFLPIGPTATFVPTNTPLPTRTPRPTATLANVPDILPTPIKVPGKMPGGITNVLVLGNDWRANSGYRTDVIELVSINGPKGTVSVISFPRDLYVTIPGWTTQRINTAFSHGGFPLLANTFEYNFGVRPTHYIMTNFQGFVGIINGLGGIKVTVGKTLSDKCDLPQSRGGICTVKPGIVPMDGAMALWYVRSRHSTSDFDRGRRSQEVMRALFNKFMTMNALSRIPGLYADYRNSVETDMSVQDIAALMPVTAKLVSDPSRIHQYAVTPSMVTNYIAPGGAMVLLPNFNAVNKMIHDAISGE